MSDMKPPFEKILIANRGEIAIRVMAAVHALGCKAVAVYSDADESALHVLHADEAYRIGPGPASQSYLNIEAILDAARKSGAQAIHPGYGFLSENADFAEAVAQAGLVFVGPPASVIRLMGDKIAAKTLMAENGIPLVPGYQGEQEHTDIFAQEAERIGYPVMVKAAAGGGGRGMRTVERPEQLPEAIEAARREAISAFGDGRLFLEKLLIDPRHIEVQVLADSHGNIIHLYERDCSLQRRHQKVIEEAPSPALSEEQRKELCEAAVRAAASAGYVNAGTVEFVWKDGKFYFLEMNTRIQVEHPVTELVTDKDLVRAQIEIAAGATLPWRQEDISLRGHAMEARLYAEDPSRNFLPQSGTITSFRTPEVTTDWRTSSPGYFDGLALDAAVDSGSVVSQYYDAMVAKLLAWGQTREQARLRLIELSSGTQVKGIGTNREFLLWALDSPAFATGEAGTAFIDSSWNGEATTSATISQTMRLGAAAAALMRRMRPPTNGMAGPLQMALGWRQGNQAVGISLELVQHSFAAERVDRSAGRIRLEIEADRLADGSWNLRIDGESFESVRFHRLGSRIGIRLGDQVHHVDASRGRRWPSRETLVLLRTPEDGEWDLMPAIRQPATATSNRRSGRAAASSGNIVAPMPSTVVKVNVSEGDAVSPHQQLIVVEAMKMEHVLEAPHAGTVKAIHRQVGDLVPAGDVLIEIAAQ